MKFLRGLGRVVSAPVRVPARWVRETRQVLTLRDRAVDVVDHLEAAAADARLYSSSTWWRQLAQLLLELAVLIPIAPEAKVKLQSVLLKAGIVVGVASTFVGSLIDPQVLSQLPPKLQGWVLTAAGVIGTAAALLHKAPGNKPAEPPKVDQPAE